VGIDVSETAVNMCKEMHKGDKSKSFYLYNDYISDIYDLALSLDVIYHLLEDDVFDVYMTDLFRTADRFVIIYSSNGDKLPFSSPHIKDRNFTKWVEENEMDFKLIKVLKNRYPYTEKDPINTSISDFYIYEKQQ
jgi:hypothetical protein